MWGKIDQGWARNRKVRKASKDAKLLWIHAFSESNAAQANGVVDDLVAELAATLAKVDDHLEVAKELVTLKLWHDTAALRDCKVCKAELGGQKLPPGAWYFHQWREHNLTKEELDDPRLAFIKKRKQELSKNRPLCNLIYDRDGDHCRYCGDRFDGGTNKKKSRQIDHVDPDGPNMPWNLAASCKTCNGRKGHRLPWEAGMFLAPPPRPRGHTNQGPQIPDATYEGDNPAMTLNPCTGRPWSRRGVNPGVDSKVDTEPTPGQHEGQHRADTVVDLSSRAHATRPRVGSERTPGRLPGQPGADTESTPESTHTESTDGLSPDGLASDARVLPLHGDDGGDVA